MVLVNHASGRGADVDETRLAVRICTFKVLVHEKGRKWALPLCLRQARERCVGVTQVLERVDHLVWSCNANFKSLQGRAGSFGSQAGNQTVPICTDCKKNSQDGASDALGIFLYLVRVSSFFTHLCTNSTKMEKILLVHCRKSTPFLLNDAILKF